MTKTIEDTAGLTTLIEECLPQDGEVHTAVISYTDATITVKAIDVDAILTPAELFSAGNNSPEDLVGLVVTRDNRSVGVKYETDPHNGIMTVFLRFQTRRPSKMDENPTTVDLFCEIRQQEGLDRVTYALSRTPSFLFAMLEETWRDGCSPSRSDGQRIPKYIPWETILDREADVRILDISEEMTSHTGHSAILVTFSTLINADGSKR